MLPLSILNDDCIRVFARLIKMLEINATQMRNFMTDSYMLATDLADYLVRKGPPFRQAHGTLGELDNTAGKLVQYAIDKSRSFRELTLDEYHRFSPLFAEDVYDITMETSAAARNAVGGTAQEQVAAALARARKLVGAENER